MDTADFALHLDFANHHANATKADIISLCHNVLKYGFHGAFVNPVHIALTKETLAGRAQVGTAFSFPLGQETVPVKVLATKTAAHDGADELDAVPDLSKFLEGNDETFLDEMKAIVTAARDVRENIIVKFILETGYIVESSGKLDTARLSKAAALVKESGADYVKICSGMGPRGASLEDYTVVRQTVGPTMKIKVAGGVSTYPQAKVFVDAGVTRIGTSKAIEIITEATTVAGGQAVLSSE